MTAGWGFASSTGLDFTESSIVDSHFAACREHYLELLGTVGIRPGWHVLDAGCGSGSFLPAIAQLVGEHGRVSAIDLAAEHVPLATRQAAAAACPVDVRCGSVLRLPYPDATFDAVWCANTVQYLDDDELRRALAELCRVVRDGGLVAIKDLDATLVTTRPGDPFQFTDFFRLAARTPGYARQLLRTRDLHRWLTRAGLTAVRQHTVLIEHYAPLSPAAAGFYRASCAQLARQAIQLDAPGDWRPFLEPVAPPDYVSEGNVLAVGVVARPTGIGPARGVFSTDMSYDDTIEFSPTDWVQDQTRKILATGTTAGIEVLGSPVVLLTLRGAKTGKLRYTPVIRVEHDGRYAIVASKGGAPEHPTWYHNIKAHPEFPLQDGTVTKDYVAREVDGAERAEWWERAVAAYPSYAEYQKKTDRQIPVFVLSISGNVRP